MLVKLFSVRVRTSNVRGNVIPLFCLHFFLCFFFLNMNEGMVHFMQIKTRIQDTSGINFAIHFSFRILILYSRSGEARRMVLACVYMSFVKLFKSNPNVYPMWFSHCNSDWNICKVSYNLHTLSYHTAQAVRMMSKLLFILRLCMQSRLFIHAEATDFFFFLLSPLFLRLIRFITFYNVPDLFVRFIPRHRHF